MQPMRVNGVMVSRPATVSSHIRMETSIQARGLKIRCMDQVDSSTKWDQYTLENGNSADATALATRNGQMVQNTQVNMLLVKKKELVHLRQVTVLSTLGSGY